jgi:hypothetical protein
MHIQGSGFDPHALATLKGDAEPAGEVAADDGLPA